MRNRVLVLAALAAIMPAASGCGAILNGSRQTIQVNSAPDGASVNAGGATFTTPTVLSLHRKKDYTLTFSREGYADATTTVRHQTRAGIVILDVVLTGLIGVAVDASTGAWNKLSPETVGLTMTKVTASADGPDRIEIRVKPGKDGLHVSSDTPGVTGRATAR